jgi:hypothetical protein
VEHRLVGAARVVPAHQYRPAPLGGAGRGPWVGAGWVVLGTLLGPEGSGRLVRLPFLYGLGPGSYRAPVCVGVGGRFGSGAACMLRTTQWTRASLWPSF